METFCCTIDEVKTMRSDVAPRIQIDVELMYDNATDTYELWAFDEDTGSAVKVGHFPTDVAHIMLSTAGYDLRSYEVEDEMNELWSRP